MTSFESEGSFENGGVMGLEHTRVMVGAEINPCHIEFDGSWEPVAGYLLRCWTLPGTEFGAYLDAGQPHEQGEPIDIVMPPAAIADLIRRMEDAALELLDPDA